MATSRLVLGDNERRRDANRAWTATQEQHTASKAPPRCDRVRRHRIPASSGLSQISTPIIRPRPRTSPTICAFSPVGHALQHVVANLLEFRSRPFLDHVERGQRRSNAHRFRRTSTHVIRHPVHKLGLADGDAQRHAEAMPFAMQTMSGCTPVCFNRKPLPVRPTTLHFVDHSAGSVLVADAPHSCMKMVGAMTLSAFALDRLDKNGGDFFRRRIVLNSLSSM